MVLCGSFSGGKVASACINHSALISTKIKNGWICTSTPSICLSGVDRENFYFITSKSSGKLIEIVKFIDIILSSKLYSHLVGQTIRHFSHKQRVPTSQCPQGSGTTHTNSFFNLTAYNLNQWFFEKCLVQNQKS